jgi:hypothetical protein
MEDTSDPVELDSRPVHCVMYADDIILLSSSANGLQEKLNKLDKFCNDWCLDVNINKTKIMIFNKAGRNINHNFTVDNKNIECFLHINI